MQLLFDLVQPCSTKTWEFVENYWAPTGTTYTNAFTNGTPYYFGTFEEETCDVPSDTYLSGWTQTGYYWSDNDLYLAKGFTMHFGDGTSLFCG